MMTRGNLTPEFLGLLRTLEDGGYHEVDARSGAIRILLRRSWITLIVAEDNGEAMAALTERGLMAVARLLA
jgi:hypothetical protein